MDFFKLVDERHSVRKYLDRPVEAAKLQTILGAMNRAPSAGNLQGYEVYLVESLPKRRELVQAALEQEFLAEAPVVLVFCANGPRSAQKYAERGATLYAIQDATIACTFAMLAAKALDLDTVWVGAFDEAAVSRILGLPSEHRPIAMLPIGYAGGEACLRPRRELKDLVHPE
jgi:nitroreductase